jgi:hypothetical protein
LALFVAFDTGFQRAPGGRSAQRKDQTGAGQAGRPKADRSGAERSSYVKERLTAHTMAQAPDRI